MDGQVDQELLKVQNQWDLMGRGGWGSCQERSLDSATATGGWRCHSPDAKPLEGLGCGRSVSDVLYLRLVSPGVRMSVRWWDRRARD